MSNISISGLKTDLYDKDNNREVTDEWGEAFSDMGMDSVLLEKMNVFLEGDNATDENIALMLELLDVVDNDSLNSDDFNRLMHDTGKYNTLMSTLDSLIAGEEVDLPTEE